VAETTPRSPKTTQQKQQTTTPTREGGETERSVWEKPTEAGDELTCENTMPSKNIQNPTPAKKTHHKNRSIRSRTYAMNWNEKGAKARWVSHTLHKEVTRLKRKVANRQKGCPCWPKKWGGEPQNTQRRPAQTTSSEKKKNIGRQGDLRFE